MRDKIVYCMNNIGLIIDNKNENVYLSEYITDSIGFITFIVELEQYFDIEIPDEYLNPEKLQTLDDVEKLIEEVRKM